MGPVIDVSGMDINNFLKVSGQRLTNLEMLCLYLKCSHFGDSNPYSGVELRP